MKLVPTALVIHKYLYIYISIYVYIYIHVYIIIILYIYIYKSYEIGAHSAGLIGSFWFIPTVSPVGRQDGRRNGAVAPTHDVVRGDAWRGPWTTI